MYCQNKIKESRVVVVQAIGAASKILHHNISRKGEGGWQNMTVDDNSDIQH